MSTPFSINVVANVRQLRQAKIDVAWATYTGYTTMSSFPRMDSLPAVLDSTGWTWERYNTPSWPSQAFWLGYDLEGNRWLTKLRGSFYAYREIVFARLAQRMGWSCQSSAFLRLDKQSAKTLGVNAGEVHAAHWFMNEHPHSPCSDDCPLKFVVGRVFKSVDDFRGSKVENLMDWPKSEFAACLFGANEPPGRLFTTAHEFVIIDSEQMFSTSPCSLEGTAWWKMPDGSPSLAGRELAREVCQDLCNLSAADIRETLSIPKGVRLRKKWPIDSKLGASRSFATSFCTAQSKR